MDWWQWNASEPIEILRPEEEWEGAELPIKSSKRGLINKRACQLRDPAIFEEKKMFIYYM
ncbi:MAG: hypothetical protein ACTSUN_04030 [Promethearchaeota archaeon]